ncbi:MAG: outer membrane beta-barrel protein [Steroidobacteraceae bacterium]
MARNGLIFMVVTLIPAALLPAGAALGDDTGFYVGGSLGESSERFDPSLYRLRADTVGYQIAAGWRPLEVLAGEVDYVSFGRAQRGANYADTDGVGVFALGFLPIPVIDIYGRVGAIDWRTDVTSPVFPIRRTGTDLAYGVGAGMHWGSLGARLEYVRYDVTDASILSLASVGVSWTFL